MINPPSACHRPGRRARLLAAQLPAIALLGMLGTAQAQLLFWDGSGTSANGAVNGGAGNWSTFGTNWTNATGTLNFSWVPASSAVFTGTGGNVVVTDLTPSFNSLRFSGNGYLLSGAALLPNASPAPITVDPGITVGIANPINGAPFSLEGGGTLNLTGVVAGTVDGITVNAGRLVIQNVANSENTIVAAGATLALDHRNGLGGLRRTSGGLPSITVNGVLEFTGNGQSALQGENYDLSGTGRLDFLSGDRRLGGSNSMAGGMRVLNGSIIRVPTANLLGAGGVTVVGSSINFINNMDVTQPLTVTGSSAFFNNTSGLTTLQGVLAGSGELVLRGGSWSFPAINTHAGTITAHDVTELLVGGTLPATVVVNGGTLRGAGSVGGSVGINASTSFAGLPYGIAPGAGVGATAGTLTTGSATLAGGARLTFRVAAPGDVSDRLVINGNLAVTGPVGVTVNSISVTGFQPGITTLATYSGTGTGLSNLTLNQPLTTLRSRLDTSNAGLVNLVLTPSTPFWDGANGTGGNIANGRGGTATWNATASNWTTATGAQNDTWEGRTGNFAGTAGTVTAAGTLGFEQLNFLTTGYTITGGALTASAAATLSAGAGIVARIETPIGGSAGLTITGEGVGGGTIRLRGANTYTGGTRVTGGATLDLASASALPAGTLTLDGGTLRPSQTELPFLGTLAVPNAIVLGAGGGTLAAGGATSFPQLRVSGGITGTGALTITGQAVTLTGLASHTGGTTISPAAALSLGRVDTAEAGNILGNVAIGAGASVVLGGNAAITFGANFSGAGGLEAIGTGSYTLTGNNSHAGGTWLGSEATILIGSGSALGSGSLLTRGGIAPTLRTTADLTITNPVGFAGSTGNNGLGVIAADGDTTATLTGGLTGDGTLRAAGSGRLVVHGTSTGNMSVQVTGGTYTLLGTTQGGLEVGAGGLLRGTGTNNRLALVAGTVSPGTAAGMGTLSLAAMELLAGSTLNFRLTAPGGAQDRINLFAGGLAGGAPGSTTINVVDAGGFGIGTYTLINYTGLGTGLDALTLGLTPGGFASTLSTANAGLVQLVVSALATPTAYWDGANILAGNVANGRGGTATWDGTRTNWTLQTGATNTGWGAQTGIFAGTAGTVTVSGNQAFDTLQFRTTGYLVQGDGLTATGNAVLRVDPGVTARVDSVIGGTRLVKEDAGTLVLGAAPTVGSLFINAGTLQTLVGGALTSGSITMGDATLETTQGYAGSAFVLNGAATVSAATGTTANMLGTSGPGSLTVAGSGTIAMLGGGGHGGGTSIRRDARLLIGAGGSLTGGIANQGVLEAGSTAAVSLAGAISGAGRLVQSGPGTLTLSAANSYAGGTTIAAGQLNVTGAGTLGSGVVDLGAASGRLDVSGIGGQALVIGGLTSTNDPASQPVVALGGRTLAMGSAGSTFVFNGSFQDGGQAGGTGGSIAVNAGTQIFLLRDGQNATGNIRIASGATAQFGDGVAAGGTSSFTSVTNDGRLVIMGSPGMASLSAAAITGGGHLVFDATNSAAGGLLYGGTASHTGGTTVTAGGGLRLVGSGSIEGAIRLDGGLEVQRDAGSTLVLAGPLSGAGSVTMLGDGSTLALTNRANSHAGGTRLGEGAVLELRDTQALGSGAITLDHRAVLRFAAGAGTLNNPLAIARLGAGAGPLAAVLDTSAGDATITGAISGAGDITKQGGNELHLTGGSPLTGTMTVAGGTLRVNGAGLPGAPVVVQSGAMLAGNANIGAMSVQAGGTVSPGNSIGTVNVTGNALFAPGSVLLVETTPQGQADRVNATGTATVTGAQVRVQAGNFGTGYGPRTEYVIVAANAGVTGQFAGVTADLAFLTPSLIHNPGNVVLVLQRNSTSFPSIGDTWNRIAVATSLQGTDPAAPLPLAFLPLNLAQARAALDAISGEIHASALGAMVEESRLIRTAVLGRARQADGTGTPIAVLGGTGVAGWFQGLGANGRLGGDGNAATITRRMAGGIAGLDATAEDGRWRVGVFAGGTDNTYSISARASRAEATLVHFGVYGSAVWHGVRLSAGFAGVHGSMRTSRGAVPMLGIGQGAAASYRVDGQQVFAELSRSYPLGPVVLEPFAGIAWARAGGAWMRESGGGIGAVSGGPRSATGAWTTLGVRMEASLPLAHGMQLRPRMQLGWQRGFGQVTPHAVLSHAGGPAFTIRGVAAPRDSLVGEAGFDLRITTRLTATAGYVGMVGGRGMREHAVRAGLSLAF